MKKNLMFTLAAVGMLVFSGTASAQPTDQLLAYGSTQGEGVGSVDDDILAAMQALDEVEILLEGKNTKTQSETADIADLIAAANVSQAKPEQADDVQTAPVKAEPKAEAAIAAAPKAEPKAAPKHDVQTAPVKAQAKAVAPDGTRLAANQQGKVVSPNVETAPAPHALSLSYVKAVYMLNGVDLNATGNTIAELYQFAFAKKLVYQGTRPAIGDLVFFHNTVDRNRDGLWNDWHSMIGIVEAIDKDETISVLVFMTDKVERIYLNLKYPELYKGKKGQILNSQLRSNEGAQKGTAAKLFAGFANLLGDASSVTVIDNWKPGMKIK